MNISIGDKGFLGLLTILFITLKLLDKISWSWFWVLSPILIPLILIALYVLYVFIVIGTY